MHWKQLWFCWEILEFWHIGKKRHRLENNNGFEALYFKAITVI
jgi:hypothetical protein